MKRLLILLFLCAISTCAQSTVLTSSTVLTNTTKLGLTIPSLFPGSQWLQDETISQSCSSGSTSCTAGVGSWSSSPSGLFTTTAGSTGVVEAEFETGTAETITSAYLCTNSAGCNSGNAIATFTSPAGFAGFSSANGFGAAGAYYLNGPSGGTYITVNVSATGGAAWALIFYEHLPPSGYSETYYQSGAVAGGSADTCSTCTGGAPTSSATPVNVINFQNFNPSSSDFPATGYGYSSGWITDVNADAVCLDCSNPSAPSFTYTGGGTGVVFIWIAFQLNATYTVQQPISLVAHVVPGTANNCTPSCTLTIPSTGSGNLLRLYALTNIQQAYISSVSDGTSGFTVPAGCESPSSTGSNESSCGFLLSSNSGKTSLSITMSTTSADVYFSYWEVKKTGSWTLDTGSPQCTLNASGTYTPVGQALTLNNTSTPHVVFQSITAEGGLGGVTLVPWTFNPIASSQGYSAGIGPNPSAAADAMLLNTKNGNAPTWATPQENTITTGVCAEAFY